MRFKLDENFNVRLVPLFTGGGHDVDTVRGEQLSGRSEDEVMLRHMQTNRPDADYPGLGLRKPLSVPAGDNGRHRGDPSAPPDPTGN